MALVDGQQPFARRAKHRTRRLMTHNDVEQYSMILPKMRDFHVIATIPTDADTGKIQEILDAERPWRHSHLKVRIKEGSVHGHREYQKHP